jgi:hypothetical protein
VSEYQSGDLMKTAHAVVGELASLRVQLAEAVRERDHWRNGVDRIADALGIPKHQDEIGVVDGARAVVDQLAEATSERDRLRVLNGFVGGDIESQARAWSAVYKRLSDLGMDSFVCADMSGLGRALGFIDKLAADAGRQVAPVLPPNHPPAPPQREVDGFGAPVKR